MDEKDEQRAMRPTSKMRWLRLHMANLGAARPSAIRIGDTTYCQVLQQWWVPIAEDPDDWKTWDSGEWRDIPMEE